MSVPVGRMQATHIAQPYIRCPFLGWQRGSQCSIMFDLSCSACSLQLKGGPIVRRLWAQEGKEGLLRLVLQQPQGEGTPGHGTYDAHAHRAKDIFRQRANLPVLAPHGCHHRLHCRRPARLCRRRRLQQAQAAGENSFACHSAALLRGTSQMPHLREDHSHRAPHLSLEAVDCF